MVIDGFLSLYDDLRQFADYADFSDETNPADGVIYPKICKDVPRPIREEIIQRLALVKGAPIERYTLFLRQSPEGVHCPHQAHTDNSMGAYSLMLYLNRQEHCRGGTSLLRHKASGIAYAPESMHFLDTIQVDQNNPDAWAVIEIVEMTPNRAFIFDATRIHRAEPVGGFGSTNLDARVVLTCFFS